MRILKRILLALLGLVTIFALYVQFGFNKHYDAPYPEVRISTDSATLAHGEYLVFGPAHCAHCHINPDQAEDLNVGKKVSLSGGKVFKLPFATIYPKNLTPDKETGIGNLTDGELTRTLRYAVDHDGHSILPFMPFTNMSTEDMSAIISYLRAQDPVRNFVPESKYNFMGKALKRFLITPPEFTADSPAYVKPDTTIVYGKYLADNVANCKGCHTPFNMQKMQYEPPLYRGGNQMEEETHLFTTPNLTPDSNTGHITGWSESDFVKRFKGGRVYQDSPMPWEAFDMMSEQDLKAIYRYLQSLDPVGNKIEMIVAPNYRTKN